MRLVDGRSWAVLPTLVINWAVFAQIVSFQGLVLWVAAPSLVCWFVVSVMLNTNRLILAWICALLVPLIFASLAEFIGGTSSGSITRAALVTCGLATSAALIASTRYARLLLVPMTLLLISALALGAAGHAIAWVGAWVVAAGFTLVILGPYAEHELIPVQRLRFLVIVMGIAGIVAVIGAVLADFIIRRPWVVHPEGLVDRPDATPTPTPTITAPGVRPPESGGLGDLLAAIGALAVKGLILLGIALVIWFVIGVARRLLVGIGWRLGLRELETGVPREQVLGAWTWVRLRLTQRDQSLPLHLSPDVAVRWATEAGRPDLAELAALVAPVAFGADVQPTPEEAYRAWELADEIEHAAQGSSLRLRWKYSLRSITATRLELAHQAVAFNQRAAEVPL